MSNLLPKRSNPVKASRIGPKILLLYSKPKVGKTDALVKLAAQFDTLTVDGEEGTNTYDTTKINVENMDQVLYIPGEIEKEGQALKDAGKQGMAQFPYLFTALDTLDSIEEMAVPYCTRNYNSSVLAKKDENKVDTILDLPKGLGYWYVREAIKEVIKAYARVSPYVILTSHAVDKIITGKDEKSTSEVKVNDLSLTGKLGGIVSAMCDAIGYMYRNSKGELRVSFESHTDNTAGARQKYLAGQDMPFSWKTIYPELFPAEEAEKS